MNAADARAALEAAYRTEKRRVLATLIRVLGGFDAAEEALHEAFAAAADKWARDGVPARLDSVLRVIYLIFNEGYAATEGPHLTRTDLCSEALRLGRLTAALLDDPDALGLLALMLLHESRRSARIDTAGDMVLLEDQDRMLWNRQQIAEAQDLIARAQVMRRVGPYLLQAAIAAVHAEAPSIGATDWTQIVALYDVLFRVEASPVVTLNRAVALGMRDGFDAGLAAIEAALAQGGLDDYHLAHAARADMQRRLGRADDARTSYRRALELTRQPAERRFLESRLAQIDRVGARSSHDTDPL